MAGLERLKSNPYPGRGIVVGVEANGNYLLQIYWIMGRSENSRNRVFRSAGRRLFTEPVDPTKVQDPSLIIYNAMDEFRGGFVVSNGNQTDSLIEALKRDIPFSQAMPGVTYEPDAPNFTPRITALALVRPPDKPSVYMSILRKAPWDDSCQRIQYYIPSLPKGIGFCITTYMGDGDPLPSFRDEPFMVPLTQASIADTLTTYWDVLNAKNRVAVAVKRIKISDGSSTINVINKYRKL